MSDYNAGQAYLTVLPSLDGFGEKVREELAKENYSATVPVTPEVDTAEIDARIDEIKAKLEELSGSDVKIKADDEDAKATIDALKAELDELTAKRASISVRADAEEAKAELDDVRTNADELDGKNVDVKVKTSGADESKNDISALMLAGVALGPAIIPVAAAVAAALGAIGIGALAGVAALGTIKLAFSGIGGAVSELESAQTQQGQNAAQNAAQQISSANSVASAQDGVKAAVTAVSDAQHQAALANQQAAEQVADAQRGVADAYISTGISIQNALDSQTQAEQTLANAQQQEQVAQESLTLARQDAQRQIESLTLSVQDGALAERSAQLGIEQAKENLDKVLANPTATQLQREQAQLAYDQSVQQLTDVQARNKNLQEDQAAAVKAGVDGSQQVQAAQRGVAAATQATANAQQGLQKATDAVSEARRAGAEKIAVAEQTLSDAQAKQAETARAGAESVAKAQQGVISAQRSLQDALAQQAAQAASAAQANNQLQQALSKLTPEGQEFARFIVSLKPQLTSLQEAAQKGLLPGVQAGIEAMLPLMPQLTGLVGSVSTALGNLARDAGTALNSPYWRGFITFVQSEAGPSITTFGTILGNLAHGFAGLLEAVKPVWDQMGAGLTHLSQEFADFGAGAGQNSGFQQFLAYVEKEGPVVVHTIGDLIAAFVNIGRALGPLGGVVLGLVDDVAHFIATMNPTVLAAIVVPIMAIYEATKLVQLGMNLWTDAVKAWGVAVKVYEGIAGVITAIKDAQLIATAATYAQSAAATIVSGATSVWTAAQWLLNIALDANPIGIVIVAIGALVAAVVFIASQFTSFGNIVNVVWTGFKDVVQAVWDGTIKPVFDLIGAGLGVLGNLFNIFLDAVKIVINGVEAVFGALTGNWSLVQTAFSSGMDNLQNIWNRLVDIAKAPVNFVINTVYNGGIVPLWNGIAGVFGLSQLQPATALAQGGVLPGYAPGRDTIPAVLSAGEGVLVPEAVRGLGADFVHQANSYFSGGRANSRGVQTFADGGIVGAIGGAVSSAWDAISGVFTDPVGTIQKLFSGVTGSANNTPGTGLLHQALVDVPGKIVDAVIQKAKDLVSSIGSALTGGGPAALDGWITTALNLMGLPLTYLPGIHSLIMHESGGNPNAINLTDSNAAAGHPSQGLMQTIPSTYAAYVLPSLAALPITNPISNITAGVRYALANYGPAMLMAGGNHDASGNYIGYDSGGWLPPGLTLAYNGTNQHERILTGPQFANLTNAATTGSGNPITINVHPRENHSEADIADMVSRRLSLALRASV